MRNSTFRSIFVVTEKNIRIYYNKAPVIIFGLLFPLFLFFAFYLGRKIDISVFFPGFIAMALFFTSSSVGPLITPWEKQAGTYERLLSYPVSVGTVIIGDVLAGSLFGLIITTIALIVTTFFLDIAVKSYILITTALILGGICFASLGVLLASPSVSSPSHVMMISSLIRFPLIFISGIFIPLSSLQGGGRILSYISPLTYLVDLFNAGLTEKSVFHPLTDILALILFSLVFLFIAYRFHKRNLMKGM